MTAQPRHPSVDLVVFDIAGTTIEEGSIVYEALRSAVAPEGAEPDAERLDAVKGMDKVTAIRTLLTDAGRDGDDDTVQACFERFTTALREGYEATPPQPMPGAVEVVERLHADGIAVALTTGFTREVAESVLDAAGWGPDLYDALVTTDDVPAGRPAPYLIHAAMRATGAQDVRRVVSCGDTIADVQSALNAGVTAVAVLSGDSGEQTLRAQHPHHLLRSVADLYTDGPLA